MAISVEMSKTNSFINLTDGFLQLSPLPSSNGYLFERLHMHFIIPSVTQLLPLKNIQKKWIIFCSCLDLFSIVLFWYLWYMPLNASCRFCYMLVWQYYFDGMQSEQQRMMKNPRNNIIDQRKICMRTIANCQILLA